MNAQVFDSLSPNQQILAYMYDALHTEEEEKQNMTATVDSVKMFLCITDIAKNNLHYTMSHASYFHP